MNKLAKCYWLYSADWLLCKQKADIRKKRCVSYGNWLPYNFPEEGLKRKLQELVCHISKQARLSSSVGLDSEQAMEAVHPKMNRWSATFASFQINVHRFAAIAECRTQNAMAARHTIIVITTTSKGMQMHLVWPGFTPKEKMPRL